jgi:dCMP deaminase
MNYRIRLAHMRAAEVYAQMSYAVRRKVGAVIVSGDTIIGIGYNGTPKGWDNHCEGDDGLTLPIVMHAEQNALDKVTRSTASSVGATLFVTTAPCIECAKRILGAGISSVYYRDTYKNQDGIDFLTEAGVPAEKL